MAANLDTHEYSKARTPEGDCKLSRLAMMGLLEVSDFEPQDRFPSFPTSTGGSVFIPRIAWDAMSSVSVLDALHARASAEAESMGESELRVVRSAGSVGIPGTLCDLFDTEPVRGPSPRRALYVRCKNCSKVILVTRFVNHLKECGDIHSEVARVLLSGVDREKELVEIPGIERSDKFSGERDSFGSIGGSSLLAGNASQMEKPFWDGNHSKVEEVRKALLVPLRMKSCAKRARRLRKRRVPLPSAVELSPGVLKKKNSHLGKKALAELSSFGMPIPLGGPLNENEDPLVMLARETKGKLPWMKVMQIARTPVNAQGKAPLLFSANGSDRTLGSGKAALQDTELPITSLAGSLMWLQGKKLAELQETCVKNFSFSTQASTHRDSMFNGMLGVLSSPGNFQTDAAFIPKLRSKLTALAVKANTPMAGTGKKRARPGAVTSPVSGAGGNGVLRTSDTNARGAPPSKRQRVSKIKTPTSAKGSRPTDVNSVAPMSRSAVTKDKRTTQQRGANSLPAGRTASPVYNVNAVNPGLFQQLNPSQATTVAATTAATTPGAQARKVADVTQNASLLQSRKGTKKGQAGTAPSYANSNMTAAALAAAQAQKSNIQTQLQNSAQPQAQMLGQNAWVQQMKMVSPNTISSSRKPKTQNSKRSPRNQTKAQTQNQLKMQQQQQLQLLQRRPTTQRTHATQAVQNQTPLQARQAHQAQKAQLQARVPAQQGRQMRPAIPNSAQLRAQAQQARQAPPSSQQISAASVGAKGLFPGANQQGNVSALGASQALFVPSPQSAGLQLPQQNPLQPALTQQNLFVPVTGQGLGEGGNHNQFQQLQNFQNQQALPNLQPRQAQQPGPALNVGNGASQTALMNLLSAMRGTGGSNGSALANIDPNILAAALTANTNPSMPTMNPPVTSVASGPPRVPSTQMTSPGASNAQSVRDLMNLVSSGMLPNQPPANPNQPTLSPFSNMSNHSNQNANVGPPTTAAARTPGTGSADGTSLPLDNFWNSSDTLGTSTAKQSGGADGVGASFDFPELI